MGLYLHTKFQFSSVILTSFRQGVILSPTSKRTPKKPTQIRVKVSYTLTIIGLIAESTLRFIKDPKYKFFWNVIFK